MDDVFDLLPGRVPLLVSIPHGGTALPLEIAATLTDAARQLRDTDWHLDRLYDFAADLGASVLRAKVSRYAIDLNRPPDGASLYPGQTTTGLCPTETFRGEPLYAAGATPTSRRRTSCAPDAAERARRLDRYWHPYHDALVGELARLKAEHGRVLLWDAHSIASRLPLLFDGKLPDLNFGSNDGRSADADVLDAVLTAASGAPFTRVVDGRFKGGYITRRYGRPAEGVQAIQLEMCQCLYMDEEPPFDYRPGAESGVKPVLRRMLEAGLRAAGAPSPSASSGKGLG